MLVLTRRIGETIRIGDDVEVRVTEIQGSRVRLAVNAPRDIRIVRGELADASVCPTASVSEPKECRAASQCVS